MRKCISIGIVFILTSCHLKNEQPNTTPSPQNSIETKKTTDTAVWLDTITMDKKFLKIYSTSQDKYNKIYAEWGKEKIIHKSLVLDDAFISTKTPYDGEITWTTPNSFALVNSCGTGCAYVILYNIEKEKPFWTEISYVPNWTETGFSTDNPNLYISQLRDSNHHLSIKIVDTDSQKSDTVAIPKHWERGVGGIFDIIDSINIKHDFIQVFQYKGKRKSNLLKVSKRITLK